MEISRLVFQDMIDHASEQFPLESCGLLVGRAGRIERLIRTENVGIYHSHPTSPAWPSNRDIEEFHDRSASYWIVSLQKKLDPVVRCFCWENESFVPQPYALCDSGIG